MNALIHTGTGPAMHRNKTSSDVLRKDVPVPTERFMASYLAGLSSRPNQRADNDGVNAIFRSIPTAIARASSLPGLAGSPAWAGMGMLSGKYSDGHTDLGNGFRRSSSAAPTPNDLHEHVVHIVKHCGYGNGNVHVAIDLACMQREAGYKVTVISAGGTFVPLLERWGVRHITMPHEQKRPFDVLKAAWRVVNLVRKEDVTVLHAHMMSSAFVGYIASRLTGLPLVTTVHNSFDPHSILMRLGDKVVAVSESERMALLGKGYPKNKVTAVVNAPDRSPRMEFGQHDPEPEIEGPCIVAANALHRRKGVFDLIEACKQVMPSFPEWKLYIAGEGPDREVLEQKVKEEGLGDRVTFLGFLKNPRPLMNKADIFVLASYADPCSLAVGEARCAGSAIIATHVGGTPEMLEFGKAGRLIAPGRPDQLAAALRGLMEDDEARRHLQQAALEGSEKFDVRCLVPAYADVYMQAKLQRRAGGQALQTSTLSDTPAA